MMSELVSGLHVVLKGIQTIVKNVKNFPKIKDKVESLLTCTMSVLNKFRPGEDPEKNKVVADLKTQLIQLEKLANDMTGKPGQESWTNRAWTMFQKSLDTYGKRYDTIHKEIDEILNTMTNFLALDSANLAQDSANMLKELLNEKNKRYAKLEEREEKDKQMMQTLSKMKSYAENKDFDSLLTLAKSVTDTCGFLTLQAKTIIEEMINALSTTWQKIEQDGQIYYHNAVTDETAWEIPEIIPRIEKLQKHFVGGGMLKHEKLEKLENIASNILNKLNEIDKKNTEAFKKASFERKRIDEENKEILRRASLRSHESDKRNSMRKNEVLNLIREIDQKQRSVSHEFDEELKEKTAALRENNRLMKIENERRSQEYNDRRKQEREDRANELEEEEEENKAQDMEDKEEEETMLSELNETLGDLKHDPDTHIIDDRADRLNIDIKKLISSSFKCLEKISASEKEDAKENGKKTVKVYSRKFTHGEYTGDIDFKGRRCGEGDMNISDDYCTAYFKNNKIVKGDGLEHSKSTLFFGKWQDGKPHGECVQYYSSKFTSIGAIFANGKMIKGYGMSEQGDGSYVGEHNNGKMHGYGELTFTEKRKGSLFSFSSPSKKVLSKYRGTFKNGVKDGPIEMTDEEGKKYIQLWKNNKVWAGEVKHSLQGKGTYVGLLQDGKFYGKGEMTYENGDFYSGYWKNGTPNGLGVMKYKNGNKYDGRWKEGEKSGYGILSTDKGAEYRGYWKHDTKNGTGKLLEKNGTYYDGDWVKDKKHGSGEYYCSKTNLIFDGTFKNNLKDGTMAIRSKNESTSLISTWKNDRIWEGNAIIHEPNGDVYTGQFVKGKRHKLGTLVFSSSSEPEKKIVYSGEWKENKREGHGITTYNKKEYENTWYKDKIENGEGVQMDINGNLYIGGFKNSKYQGKGSLLYASNNNKFKKYVGDFVHGRKEGQGIQVYRDNSEYTGSFAKDLRSGSGRFTMANGGNYNGNWKNDKREGNGEQQYNNGSHYNGEWKNDNRDGCGIFKEENGNVYDGNWKNDKKHGKGKTKARGRTSVYEAVFEVGNAISGAIAKQYNNGLYKGDVYKDQRHGSGKMEYSNGDVYIGNWVRNKKHGHGKNTRSKNGDVYEGDWNNGFMDGKGKLTWADGSAFDGNWKQNRPSGNGKFTCQNGHTIHGTRFYQEEPEPIYSCFCCKDGETKASFVAFGGNDSYYTLTIPNYNIEVSGLWHKTVLRIGTEATNYSNIDANVNPAKLKQGKIKSLLTGSIKDVPPKCLRFEDIPQPAGHIKPKDINTGNSKGAINQNHQKRMSKVRRLSQQIKMQQTSQQIQLTKNVEIHATSNPLTSSIKESRKSKVRRLSKKLEQGRSKK
jgi:hypothetical protein